MLEKEFESLIRSQVFWILNKLFDLKKTLLRIFKNGGQIYVSPGTDAKQVMLRFGPRHAPF